MTDPRNDLRAGIWRLADPKISLASFAGMFLAACFAAVDVGLHLGWLALTVLGVFCVEVAKNASGEVIDFDSGTDQAIREDERSPFSGGKRVLVDGLLTRRQTWAIAALGFGAAIVIGLLIAVFRDTRVLVFGLPGMALAWYYHGGSLRLAYRGWGEVAVAIAYGPLVVLGTYFVQAGYLNATLIHLSMILGLLVAAFLWINEFPDYRADREAGKHNLVVRLGRERAALVYVVLVASAYGWLVLLVLWGPHGKFVWPGLVGALPASFAAWRLQALDDGLDTLVPAQVSTLLSFLLMAAGAGLGYVLL
jgi:1,4-dihydroxy-2-naphthoate octaprenyltransferase